MCPNQRPSPFRGEGLSPCDLAARATVHTAARAGIDLPADSASAFSKYCEAIIDVSTRINVTAVRHPEEIGKRLFLDSITILAALAPYPLENPTVVDVGSGAGIPGIPLAIARPTWSFTLVESIEKKAAFLRHTIESLSLSRVQVSATRAELLAQQHGRDQFDLAVARAVAALPTLLEWCGPLVRSGGMLALPKSGDVETEILSATEASVALNLVWAATYPVPEALGLGSNRSIVVYRKTGPTPPGFPRLVGLAKSQPIGGEGSTAATSRARRPRQK